ncbi:MAG: glycosyltransferase family 4 protein [Candidatus Omnitrophica bacterium]|nr:glycosyltransferase family 4 protein [Candidatus Omnitrophota bacterium]
MTNTRNKKTKILRVITRLNIGGPAIHVTLLTGMFNDGEFESALLCGSVSEREGDMGYIAEDYGVKPLYIPQLTREISVFRDLAAFFSIIKHIKRYKPDIVHTHTAKAGTLGRIAAILSRVPVIVHTFHGNVFQGYFSKRRTKLFIIIERILARFTDCIIAISPAQKEEITKLYRITRPDKCRVVRLGFDLERLSGALENGRGLRDDLKLAESDILVGIIGRLTAIKNQKMFVDMAYHLINTGESRLKERLKFAVIGDGELREELLAYTRFRGLAKKIFFVGWAKDMRKVYPALDIVTLTSSNEGTPVTLIEAMSFSKPVVATDTGGIKDTVRENGILVKKDDYKSMAHAVSELAVSREKRESLGRLGRDFVRATYSKERLYSEFRQLYNDLEKQKRRTK